MQISASIVYFLCAAASGLCAVLLWKEYAKSRAALLFWCALCFSFLTANNIVLTVDMVYLGTDVSLATWRGVLTALAFGVIVWGMVWNTP
jgi:hypothetical protein